MFADDDIQDDSDSKAFVKVSWIPPTPHVCLKEFVIA